MAKESKVRILKNRPFSDISFSCSLSGGSGLPIKNEGIESEVLFLSINILKIIAQSKAKFEVWKLKDIELP